MPAVFQSVTVVRSPADKSFLITWWIRPQFHPESATPEFYIDVARSGGTWTRLNPAAPVTGDNTYTVAAADGQMLSMKRDIFFRVIMDDNGTEYESVPAGLYGSLTEDERRQCVEIQRLHYTQLLKGGGISGWLLRRKEWGTACTCVDPDTQAAVNGCPLCYGTGVDGGFYDPYPFYLSLEEESPSKEVATGDTGVSAEKKQVAMAVNYPAVFPGDLWIDGYTDERYIVEETTAVARVKNVDIVLRMALARLHPLRPENNVTVAATAATGATGWYGSIDTL